MISKIEQFILLGLFLFCSQLSPAQKNEWALNEKGIITFPPNANFQRIKELKSADRTALNNTINQQFKIISNSDFLNPPVGFNIKVASGITPVSPFGNKERITYYATFAMHCLQRDNNSGVIKPTYEYSSSIKINANDLEGFCFHTGYFYKECERLKIPLFFQKFPVVSSTEDYEEINFKQYGFDHFYGDFPVRILKRNNKPVFIPYTRKEFFQFLIKYYQDNLKRSEEIRDKSKKSYKDIKNYIADGKNPEAMREAYQKSMPNYENNITQWNKNVDENRALLKKTNDAIADMTAEEAAQTTYIDMNKQGSFLEKLTQPGKLDGEPLYQINPDYFDHKSTASDVQLLVVTYEFHRSISSDFMKKRVTEIFNSIDFHQLKLSMK